MRITTEEIRSAIELYVNCIYDSDGGKSSGWADATYQEWINAVYEELTTWKNVDGECWHSNENRFDGKENIINRIKPLLTKRLERLQNEGYAIKALDNNKGENKMNVKELIAETLKTGNADNYEAIKAQAQSLLESYRYTLNPIDANREYIRINAIIENWYIAMSGLAKALDYLH